TDELTIDEHRISLPRPDKTLYPADGITKRDVVDYYREVAEVMLPHLRGRPLTLRRFPDGIDKDGFFQKEASDHFPDWLPIAEVPQRERPANMHHAMCSDTADLVYLATQACLEFHVFLSTVDALERPDRVVIDLDPSPGAKVGELREVARKVRDLFSAEGLTPYVQATAGRGSHIVAPLDPSVDFDDVRAHVRRLA